MPKPESLKQTNHFNRAYRRGSFAVTAYLVAYAYRNGLGKNRIGITVKKNIGKSVARNRLRRLIKENYRFMEPGLQKGYDIVFVARKFDEGATFMEIGGSMSYIMRKLGIREK